MKRIAALLLVMMAQGCAAGGSDDAGDEALRQIEADEAARKEASDRWLREASKPVGRNKFQNCRFGRTKLIGMARADVKAKCGAAHSNNVTTTARGMREQWVYSNIDGSPLLYVYVENGVVTAVQDR